MSGLLGNYPKVRFWFSDSSSRCHSTRYNTEKTVLNALTTLEQLAPDLVVIIRGGGSKTDLSYLDYVANRFFKTPTAVVDNIVSIFTELQRYLEGAGHHLKTSWAFNLKREKTWLNDSYIGIQKGTKKMLMYHISLLQGQGLRLSKNTIQRILAEQMGIKAKQEHLWFLSKLNLDRYRLFLHDLVRRFSMDRFLQKLSVEQQFNQSKQSTLKAMEPDYIVQRGFSILRDETGNIVSSVKVIQKGSIIHASVRDGKIVGTVNSVNSVTGEER